MAEVLEVSGGKETLLVGHCVDQLADVGGRHGGEDAELGWTRQLRVARKHEAVHHSAMSTLAQIELALPQLKEVELSYLERFVHSLRRRRAQKSRSALDLAPLRLGKVLKPLTAEDDLLEEMLDDARP